MEKLEKIDTSKKEESILDEESVRTLNKKASEKEDEQETTIDTQGE